MHAKFNFDEDISLSLIKSFPNLSIAIKDISIVGINEFENDTLFYSKTFSLSLDVMSVIKGEKVLVRKIRLDQPKIMRLF
jgi:uncharacterized protein involved in outer membrane biogenesis